MEFSLSLNVHKLVTRQGQDGKCHCAWLGGTTRAPPPASPLLRPHDMRAARRRSPELLAAAADEVLLELRHVRPLRLDLLQLLFDLLLPVDL